jgi:hypothetical protein
MQLVAFAFVFGIGLGFLLNVAYHEPWAWHGFVFGFLGVCSACSSIPGSIARRHRSSFSPSETHPSATC